MTGHLKACLEWLEPRRQGKRIVLANGCFDIFHIGHLEYLSLSKTLGDLLVVGVNSDYSFARIRKRSPYFNEVDRSSIVKALSCVDHVFLFDDDTLENSIQTILPNVYAEGIDKYGKMTVENSTAKRLGIEVAVIGEQKKASSSEIMKAIQCEEIL